MRLGIKLCGAYQTNRRGTSVECDTERGRRGDPEIKKVTSDRRSVNGKRKK